MGLANHLEQECLPKEPSFEQIRHVAIYPKTPFFFATLNHLKYYWISRIEFPPLSNNPINS